MPLTGYMVGRFGTRFVLLLGSMNLLGTHGVPMLMNHGFDAKLSSGPDVKMPSSGMSREGMRI